MVMVNDRDYFVMIRDEEEGNLHVVLTDEGIVIDLYDSEGENVGTTWFFAQDLADELDDQGDAS